MVMIIKVICVLALYPAAAVAVAAAVAAVSKLTL